MQYVTWKLKWVNDYGYGPESIVNQNDNHLEASMFASSQAQDRTILGYCKTDLDFALISDFEAQEITKEEALVFAKSIDETAYFLENGFIAVVIDEANLLLS
jgi:hypothetical protein